MGKTGSYSTSASLHTSGGEGHTATSIWSALQRSATGSLPQRLHQASGHVQRRAGQGKLTPVLLDICMTSFVFVPHVEFGTVASFHILVTNNECHKEEIEGG